MSNERPNDFLPWRAQLTKPDALPGVGLDDKELSWQRLAERLQKKPRRYGAIWWLAAAFILAFFLPATHLFHARPGPTGPDRVALHPRVSHLSVTPIEQSVGPSRQQHSRPMLSQPLRPIYPDRAALHSTIQRQTAASIRPLLSAPDTIRTGATPIAPATALATAPAAVKPPRRPLRIAYLNEIVNPGPSPVRTPRQPAFLPLGTATATEYNVNNNIPIIKIDISSRNH